MNKIRVKTFAISLVVAMVCVAVLPMAGTAQAADRCDPLPPLPSEPYPDTEFGADGAEVQSYVPWWPYGPFAQVTLEPGYSWGSIYLPLKSGMATVAGQADTQAHPKGGVTTRVWVAIRLYRWNPGKGWEHRAETVTWTSTPGLCGNYDVDAHVRSPWVGPGWYRAVSTHRVYRDGICHHQATQTVVTQITAGTAQAADRDPLPPPALPPPSEPYLCTECGADGALQWWWPYTYDQIMPQIMPYLTELGVELGADGALQWWPYTYSQVMPYPRTEFGGDGAEVQRWRPVPYRQVKMEPPGYYSHGDIYLPHGANIPWWAPFYYDWPGDVVGRTDTEARPKDGVTTTRVWVLAILWRQNPETGRWHHQATTISATTTRSPGPDGDYDADGYVGGPWLGGADYRLNSIHRVYRDGNRTDWASQVTSPVFVPDEFWP